MHIGKDSVLNLTNSFLTGEIYLEGKSESGTGVWCSGCKSIDVFNTRFKRLTSHDKGGGFYANNYQESFQVLIKNSQFVNCRGLIGGGIYLMNSIARILNSTFVNNSALENNDFEFSGQGGSIFLSSTFDNSSCYIESSQFTNNSADISGGAIQWYNKQPLLISLNFSNNYAKYGPNNASFACKLKLSSNFTPPIELIPGVNTSTYFLIEALDHYDQLVITENSSVLLATSVDTKAVTVSGSIRFKVEDGIFNISQIVVKGKPESFANISFATGFKHAGYENTEEIVEVYLRKCIVGETVRGEDSCIRCPAGTYSFEAGPPCKPCPTGAICYGDASIISAEGYWRENQKSDIFFECFLQAACLEEKIEDHDFKYKCEKGYTGKLCQGCERGYSRDGENKCAECGDEKSNIIFVTFVTAAGAAVVLLLTATTISGAYKEQSITSVYFKILTNYTQIVALTISFELDWPDLVKKLFEGQKQAVGATDRLFSIDCLLKKEIEPHYAKIILINITPAAFTIISTLLWLLKSLCFKTPDLAPKIIGSITIQIFFFMAKIIKIKF